MKEIKKLGITTQEGFSVRNLQRFPSMEWGDEGGLQAELFYNGQNVMTVYQEGNGGCAITYWTDYGRSIENEVKEQALKFLQRVDKSYGQNTPYSWLKNKTAQKMDNDDFESLVINIESRYDMVKSFKKGLKNGYTSFAEVVYENGLSRSVNSRAENVNKDYIMNFLKQNKLGDNVESIEILRLGDNLETY